MIIYYRRSITDMDDNHIPKPQPMIDDPDMGMIGKSEQMQEVRRKIAKYAPKHATVLITGETGVGKELVAKALHKYSLRDGGFSPADCGNVSGQDSSMISSKLFGHKKGAFTGATEDRDGLFKSADKGTIFLDEIGKLDVESQAKLLRVLGTREFSPEGSDEVLTTGARLIVAENLNLERMVKEGKFREDLYYRIKVASINIAPLRERKVDIPLLVNHFIKKFKKLESTAEIGTIEEKALKYLMAAPWKGNVRQLENVIQSAVIEQETGDIQLDTLLERKEDIYPKSANSTSLPQEQEATAGTEEEDHFQNVLDNKNISRGALRDPYDYKPKPSTINALIKTINALMRGTTSLYKLDKMSPEERQIYGYTSRGAVNGFVEKCSPLIIGEGCDTSTFIEKLKQQKELEQQQLTDKSTSNEDAGGIPMT